MRKLNSLISRCQTTIMLFILFGLLTVNAQDSYTASAFTQSMTNITGATTVWDGSVSSYDDEYSLATLHLQVDIGF